MSERKTLHEIVGLYDALREEADADADPNLGEIDIALDEMLAVARGDLEEKLNSIGYVIEDLESRAENYRARASYHSQRAKVTSAQAARIRARVLAALAAIDERAVETRDYMFTRRANPPSVVIDDPDAFAVRWPNLCTRTETWSPDRRELSRRLKGGEQIDGATLVAGAERLVIK
jgi:hypothetical protein